MIDPDTDIDAIIESQPEEDWEILRAMVKAGHPIYEYRTVKTPLGKDKKTKKEIFKTNHLNENLKKLNGEFKNNKLVNDVVNFILKDKKRPICTPFTK